MGEACSTHGKYEKCIKNLNCKTVKEKADHLGDLDIHGMAILKWIVKK
jgi:hypothetical protein